MTRAMTNELSALEDEALVRIATSDKHSVRSRAAASVLFARHQRRIYLWCRRVVRDHERALDLAQDAQLAAWRRLESFSHEARFSSWLFVVVRNRCLSALRRVEVLDEGDEGLADLVDPATTADRRLEDAQEENLLMTLIDEVLDPLERDALLLRCHERLPVETITEMLGLENATGARGLLQRARRKLRAARANT